MGQMIRVRLRLGIIYDLLVLVVVSRMRHGLFCWSRWSVSASASLWVFFHKILYSYLYILIYTPNLGIVTAVLCFIRESEHSKVVKRGAA